MFSCVRVCCCAGVNVIAVHVSNTAGTTALPADAGFDLDLQYNAASALTEAPTNVTSATGTAVSTTSIKVSWVKPACDGSSFVTRYAITSRSAGIASRSVSVTDPFSTTAYSQTYTGLKTKTSYTVTIQAVNAAGPSPGVNVTVTTK